MRKFFECNLPKKAASYVDVRATKRINNILTNIHNRMDKLEEALNLTGLEGEQFAKGAKILFDQQANSGESLIDTMTAKEIADYVKPIAEKMPYQKRHEWDNAEVIVDTAFLSIPEWEAIRTIGIGGSDAAIALGVSPYRTELELYYDKHCIPEELDIEKNEDKKGKEFIFSYGHKVESLVIETFCNITGAKVIPETRMFRKKSMPYITANIDAIVEMPDGRIFVFEAKTTTFFNKSAWENNKIPVQYLPQCRQYLSVLDDPKIAGTYIGCIYGNTVNEFVCSYVERDMQKEQEQLDEIKYFWDTYILGNQKPDYSGKSETDLKIQRRFSGSADKNAPAVELIPQDVEIIKEYLELNEQKKKLIAKADGITNKMQSLQLMIAEELGRTVKGTVKKDDSSYYEVSYAPRSYTSLDKKMLKASFPEVYEKVITVIPENTRVFSIKERKIV